VYTERVDKSTLFFIGENMSNARITITVPYETIPNEVEKLISKSISKMSTIVENFRNGTIHDYNKVLQDIEENRKKLLLVDANLEDAYNILLGYLQNELKQKQEKVASNEPPSV